MKKVFFFMALAVAGLAMTACGGNKEGEKNENSIATDAKDLAKAVDNVMKADDPQKTIAAADVFQKALMDSMKKYKDNKEFAETLDKELKNLGYDPETVEGELQSKLMAAQQTVQNGAMDMGDMNDMNDMGDMDNMEGLNDIDE